MTEEQKNAMYTLIGGGDGDGVRPVVVYRDENNDICDGLLVAAVKEENAG